MTDAELVRLAIEKVGSVKELAKRIGVTTRIIHLWLKEQTKARSYSIEAIQRILKQ